MSTNCNKCSKPIGAMKVRYNGLWYCTSCMDQVNEAYINAVRQFQLDVKSGKIITHDS